MIDPREHLECIVRMAAEITASLDRGEHPSQSDGRVLAWNAQVLAEHIKRVNLASIRTRSAEADKAAQFATLKGERL